MVLPMNKGAILGNLGLVADWLRVKHPGSVFELVVAGGAALALLDIERATLDVDVLVPETLPRQLVDAARAVAGARGLGPEWLSDGVARVLKQARGGRRLPRYFVERAARIDVADNLTVWVLGRQALISLKLLAASPSERKHIRDLHALAPTRSELRRARDFVLALDSSAPRREDLALVLRELGVQPR